MSVYLIYILTIIIGIYAVYMNIPALFTIGIPDSQIKFAKFMVSLIPTVVGFAMIYFGITSLISLIKKNKKEKES